MRRRILLIDDVEFTLHLEQSVFKEIENDHGYDLHIDTARTVSEALGKLERAEELYDLVISDLNLPDGNGKEIAIAASQKSMGFTKVVALTIYPHFYEQVRSYFNDFMTKPILPKVFKENVLILLNS